MGTQLQWMEQWCGGAEGGIMGGAMGGTIDGMNGTMAGEGCLNFITHLLAGTDDAAGGELGGG